MPIRHHITKAARWFAQSRKEFIENMTGLILVGGIIVLVMFFFDVAALRAAIERAGFWGPLLFIVAKASTIVFAPVSGSPLYPLAGALFGFKQGMILIVAGDALGGSIAFWISRAYGMRVVRRFVKGDISVVEKALSMISSVRGFLVARIFFAALPEVVCYAAGLTTLAFAPFFLIHVLISLVPAAILVGSGALIAGLESTWVLLGLVVLGTVAAAGGGGLFYLWQKKAGAKK